MSKLTFYGGDFFADSVIADPLPAYRQMRDTGPIVWLPENNIWAAVAYQPCLAILRKPKLFQLGRGLSLNDEVNNILIGSTLNSEAERHRRQRSITATAIMPNALTVLRRRSNAPLTMSAMPSARPYGSTRWPNSPASCRCRSSSIWSGGRPMERRACWNGPLPPLTCLKALTNARASHSGGFANFVIF